jgi:preprotein translocase subunit Sss1
MISPTVRRVLAVLAFFGTFFVVWMLMLFLPLGEQVWIGSVVALAAAAYVSRTVWNGTAEGSSSVAVMAGLGAAILGGLGFVVGFFGPMIFAPEANQGPMLGLFITGPAGVVIGAIAGAVYAKRR